MSQEPKAEQRSAAVEAKEKPYPRRSKVIGEILTMEEAAAALRVSKRWLHDFLREIPPVVLLCARKRLFDEPAMLAIRDAMKQRASQSYEPRSPRRAQRRAKTSEKPAWVKALEHLEELKLQERAQKRLMRDQERGAQSRVSRRGGSS